MTNQGARPSIGGIAAAVLRNTPKGYPICSKIGADDMGRCETGTPNIARRNRLLCDVMGIIGRGIGGPGTYRTDALVARQSTGGIPPRIPPRVAGWFA
jgi:hypothetical protein